MVELMVNLIKDMCIASIPAIGFGMIFNVPVKALKFCALGGAIGHGTRFLLLHYGVGIEWATFFGAVSVGCIGIYWSHKFLAHPKVFTVAGVIPMIPGKFAFKAMIALVELNHRGYNEALWATMIDNFLQAIFIIAGLSIGLALPGLLFYRRKPVV